MHTEDGLIRKGTVLSSSDPHAKRNPHLFTPATVGPTIDAEAMREAERRLWAQTTAGDA